MGHVTQRDVSRDNPHRWYDGWKGVAIVFASLSGAAAFGYAANDLVDQIREAPVSAQANRAMIRQLEKDVLEEQKDVWRAINVIRDDVSDVQDRIDGLTGIVWEVYCIVYADPAHRDRCLSDSARRRLDQILGQGGAS